MSRRAIACVAVFLAFACRAAPAGAPATIIFPSSTLGAEGEVLRRQIARFMQERPDIEVEQRSTPDAADQRHQLYVQWLNAHAGEPDILQLDAIWTPEFAAAEWILPLDRFRPATDSFFPAADRRQPVARAALRHAMVRGRGHALLADRSDAVGAA